MLRLLERMADVIEDEPAALWLIESALREALADFARNQIGNSRSEVARLTATTEALLDAVAPEWEGVEFVHPLPQVACLSCEK